MFIGQYSLVNVLMLCSLVNVLMLMFTRDANTNCEIIIAIFFNVICTNCETSELIIETDHIALLQTCTMTTGHKPL
jgi:hypothetical protein